jgi:hypothetical protein
VKTPEECEKAGRGVAIGFSVAPSIASDHRRPASVSVVIRKLPCTVKDAAFQFQQLGNFSKVVVRARGEKGDVPGKRCIPEMHQSVMEGKAGVGCSDDEMKSLTMG